MTDLNTIAKDVSTGTELVQGLFPFIAALIPPPYGTLVGGLLSAVDNGAKAVANGKPGATPEDIIQELIAHLTPGQPNSPALT